MTYLDDVQQSRRTLASRLEQLTKQLDEVSEKLRETEHDTLDLQRKQTAAKAKLQEVRVDLALWQKLREAEEQARKLANHLNAVQQKQTTLADRFAQLTTQLGEIAQRLKEAEQAGTLKRLFYRLDPKQLRAQHDQLASERRVVHESLTVAQRQVEDAKAMMRDSEQRLSHLQKQTQDVVDEASLRHNARVLEDGISRLDARIKEVERARALNQVQHDKLTTEQHDVRESLTATQDQMEDAALKKRDAESQLSALRTTITRRQAEGMADEASLQRSARRLEDEMSQLDTRLKEIDERMSSIEEEVLREARLIATTLTKAYLNKTVCARTFDAVIADEASMAAIPALCFAAGLSKSKVVIVGDFRQLAPIAIADDDKEPNELVRKWLRKDVFDHAGIIQAVDEGRGEQDGRLVPLTKQYRMHPSISQIPNRLIYKDLLDDQRSIDEDYSGLDSEPFPNEPLVLVDTSDVNPWCSHDPNFSRFNIYSAVVAAELARQVVEDDLNEQVKVGITTPYAIQAKLIGRILQSWGISERDVTVLNVHKFQGNERDVIIFDVADGPNLGIGKPLQGGPGSDAMRLVNVAITRPKGKLIVIANQRYCLSQLKAGFTLGEVLQLMAAGARRVDSRDVIDSYFHPDVAAAETMMQPPQIEMEELSDIAIVKDTQFYDLFLQDLARAESYVVIFSPFAARRRIDQLLAPLHALVDAGRKVYIITRPPALQLHLSETDEARAQEALDYLREVGVKVIHNSATMHEKIALIDDRIVWCGSLNIISHNRTSEIMIRFESLKFVSEIKRLWNVVGIIEPEESREERESNLETLKQFIGQQPCQQCGHAMEVKINNQRSRGDYRKPFLACPRCDNSTANIPPRTLEAFIRQIVKQCENAKCIRCHPAKCSGGIALKWNSRRRHHFLSCEHYPDCKGTMQFSTLF